MVDAEELVDDADARRIYLLEWLEPQGFDPERIYEDETYALHACLQAWLKESGYDPIQIMPPTYESHRATTEANEMTRYAALREWIRYHKGDPGELKDEALEQAADDGQLQQQRNQCETQQQHEQPR